MKSKFRLLAFLVAIVLCFGMTSCEIIELQGSKAVALSRPTNVRVDDSVLSWNFVENAVGYTVKIIGRENADIENEEGREVPVDETSMSLASLSDGKYTIGVKARGDSVVYSSSDYTAIQYTREKDTGAEYEDSTSGAFGSFDEINTKESYLGYGIDIINSTGVTSKNIKVTYPIFSRDAILNETLIKSNEHYSNLETVEASSMQEFKSKLSESSSISSGMSASASCNVFGFSAGVGVSFSNGYKQAFEQTSSETYSQYFLEIMAENQNYWLMLQTNESRYREILSEEFKRDLYDESISAAQLFDKYGTHLITSVAMGGNISMFYTLYSVEEGVTSQEYYEVASALKMNADVAYGSMASAGTSVESSSHNSQAYEALANKYGIRVEKKIVVSGGSGAFGISNEASLVNNYADWQRSLDAYPVVVGIKDSNSLYPIWNLIDTSTAEGAARYSELYEHFMTYGQESYDSLCNAYGIKAPVAPKSIENVVVKSNTDYQDGQVVQIKAGDSFQITFDVTPADANKYRKTFSSSSEFVTVDESGNVTVLEGIHHGTNVIITLTAGTVQREIKLEAIKSYNVSFNTGVSGLTVDSMLGVLSGTYLDEPKLEREGYTLVGWYRDAERTQPFDFEEDTVISDLVLYARWNAIKPVVSFDSQGGSEVASQTLKYKATATLPTAPQRAGYTFLGWYLDADCTDEFDFSTEITADLTLYADWSLNKYTVTFVTNGGTEVTPQTTTVEKGYLITEPDTARSYYVLEGWYRDEACTDKFFFTELVTGSITLYAKWTPKKIDVSFFSNGSLVTTLTTDKSLEFKITAPNDPAREGYAFGGWSFTSDGDAIDVADYTFSNENGGYELYALWSLKRYTVDFEENGGSEVISQTTHVEKGYLITEPTVTRSYYVLEGWYRDEAFTDKFSFTELVTESITLYARWIPKEIEVEFYNGDGALIATKTTNVEKSFAISAPEVTDVEGYEFLGWSLSPDGAIIDLSTYSFNNESVEYKLYERWSVKEYAVTFVVNGGTPVDPQIVGNDENYLATQPTVTRSYYLFGGWYRDEALTVEFSFTEEITESISLYAKWTPKKIEVHFLDHDGTELTSAVTDVEKDFIIAAPATPEREGYVFLGWSFEPDGDNVDVESYVFSDESAEYKLYAKWIDDAHANPFTLTVNYVFADGSTAHESYVAELYCDQSYSVDTPYTAALVGYAADLDRVYGVMPAEDVTVTVTYTEREYTVYVICVDADGDELYRTSFTYNYNEKYSINTSEIIIDGYVPKTSTLSGTMPAEDLELTVTYRPVNYSVIYDANGGTGTMDATNMVYDVYDYLAENAFSRTGYTFSGWNTAPDGTGTSYTARQYVKNLANEDNALVTLYAQWENNFTYSVIYDANGGSGSMQSSTFVYDVDGYLASNEFTKEGYAFAGWNTAADGTGTAYRNSAQIRNLVSTANGSLILYAQWTGIVNYYTVSTTSVSCAENNGFDHTAPDSRADNYHYSHDFELGKFYVANCYQSSDSSYLLTQEGGAGLYFRMNYDSTDLPLQDTMTARTIFNDTYTGQIKNAPYDVGGQHVGYGLLIAKIVYDDGTEERILIKDFLKDVEAGEQIFICNLTKPCTISIAICYEVEMWAPGFLGISDRYYMNWRINQTFRFE